jgi:hypothetical protein
MLKVEAAGFSAFYPSAALHDPQPRRRCSYLNLTGIWRGWAERMGSSDGPLCRQYVTRNAEIPFVPVFPRQSQFYLFQRPVSWCTAKLGSGRQSFWVFPRHKSKTFVKLRTNVLAHHIARKDLDELSCHHQPLTGGKRRGSGRCVDLRLRTVRKRYVYCTSVAVSLSSSSSSTTSSLFHFNIYHCHCIDVSAL